MTDFLTPVIHGTGYSFLFPCIFLLAAYGAGGLCLRLLKFNAQKSRIFLSFVCGLDIFAVILLAGLCLFPGPGTLKALGGILILSGVIGFFFAEKPDFSLVFRKQYASLLWPGVILLVFAGFLFSYPSGWDECVYQFAVPRRWAESGTLAVFHDLPYSGFPGLPQILYVPVYAAGGVMGIRVFTFLCQCILTAGVLWQFRHCRTAGIIVVSAFLLAPIATSGFCHSYAELFIALNLLAGLSCKTGEGTKNEVMAGCFAGAAAAVKLSGFLPAACFLLWRILRTPKGKRGRILLPFLVAGAIFAGLFYARPMLETGNPCHPYLANVFSPDRIKVSEYHHRMGTDRFGYENKIYGFIRSFGNLSEPSRSKVFDGCYGLTFLLWLKALAVLLILLARSKRNKSKIPLLFFPLFLFYIGWYLSSPQARFLAPGFLFAIPAGILLLRVLTRKKRIIFLALLAVCAVVSIPWNTWGYLGKNWKQALTGDGQGHLDLLYGRTGDDYLPACFLLNDLQPKEGPLLLLFEERTLYMPSCARIGTPLFQDQFLADELTADAIWDELVKKNIRTVYLRLPVNNPDLLEDMLALYPPVKQALFELVRQGKLQVARQVDNQEAFVFLRNKW